MDRRIKYIVEDKLNKYNITSHEKLSDKCMERLVKVEKYIQENSDKAKLLIQELKSLQLTKTSISNSDKIGISRKTIYNDKVLNSYIEVAISESEDYFNENKVIELQGQLHELKDDFDKLIDKIIKENNLKLLIKDYEKQIEILMKENESLQVILNEKNNTIKILQASCSEQNKILEFKKTI